MESQLNGMTLRDIGYCFIVTSSRGCSGLENSNATLKVSWITEVTCVFVVPPTF